MYKRTSIAIDEKVYDKLISLRKYPSESHNDVLRRLLKIQEGGEK